MHRKFLEILMVIAKEIVEKDIRIEEASIQLQDANMDFRTLSDEIGYLEHMDILTDEETDAMKCLLVYILLKNTRRQPDEIYSMVFSPHKRIIWN